MLWYINLFDCLILYQYELHTDYPWYWHNPSRPNSKSVCRLSLRRRGLGGKGTTNTVSGKNSNDFPLPKVFTWWCPPRDTTYCGLFPGLFLLRVVQSPIHTTSSLVARVSNSDYEILRRVGISFSVQWMVIIVNTYSHISDVWYALRELGPTTTLSNKVYHCWGGILQGQMNRQLNKSA